MTNTHDFSSMDTSELEQILNEVGLNKKETKVYLELLHLGEGFPGHIANKTGINRTAVYVVLKQLTEKGLAGMKSKWGQQCFVAKSCDSFLNMQKDDYEKRIKKIERAKKINKTTAKLIEINSKDELNILCKMIIENISAKTKPVAAALFIKNEQTKRAEVKAITSTQIGNLTLKLLRGRFYNLSTPYENPIDNVGECFKNGIIIEAASLSEYICPTVSNEIAEKIIKMGAGPSIIIPLSTHGAILFSYAKNKDLIKQKKNILESCKNSEELLSIYFRNKVNSHNNKILQKKTLSILKKIIPKVHPKEKNELKGLEKEIKKIINNQ